MTFKVGDEVTFYWKGRLRLTGVITEFEKLSAYTDQPADTEVVATVRVPGNTLADHGGNYGALKLSKLTHADHPLVKAAAAVPKQKPGALVRVAGLRGKVIAGVSDGSVAVVLADKGDRLNVVAVGGSADLHQYLRVPRHMVTPVALDLEKLLHEAHETDCCCKNCPWEGNHGGGKTFKDVEP